MFRELFQARRSTIVVFLKEKRYGLLETVIPLISNLPFRAAAVIYVSFSVLTPKVTRVISSHYKRLKRRAQRFLCIDQSTFISTFAHQRFEGFEERVVSL